MPAAHPPHSFACVHTKPVLFSHYVHNILIMYIFCMHFIWQDKSNVYSFKIHNIKKLIRLFISILFKFEYPLCTQCGKGRGGGGGVENRYLIKRSLSSSFGPSMAFYHIYSKWWSLFPRRFLSFSKIIILFNLKNLPCFCFILSNQSTQMFKICYILQ